MQGNRGILAALVACAGLTLAAGPATAGTRPSVVELFTSQGCSSCPPADALLRELAGRGDVLALGYHIDYWDRLGWKDPLSSAESTARQRAYAERFHGGQLYTPQLVLDGTDEMIGSDRAAVLAALRAAHPAAAAAVDFAADGSKVAIGGGSGAGMVLLVRFAKSRTTEIRAGENRGRTAEDTNGVTSVSLLGAWQGKAVDFAIAPPAPGEGVAVLVQAPDGTMLGAGSLAAPPILPARA